MVLLAAVGASACSAVTAQAQTQLPGITVTTPSPVAPSPPPAQAPAAAPQQTAPRPRPCRHRPADFSRPELRGDHGRHAPAVAQPAVLDAGRRARARPGIAGNDVRAGRQPAGHPRLERLSRPHPGERAFDRRRVGAERRSRRADRSARPPARSRWCAGPATLRYGSQAIGGVVNAINNRIPDRDSRQRHPASRRAAASARWTMGATAPRSWRRAPAISSSTPTPSRGRPATTASPAGTQANTSLDSERLLARRLLSCSRTASSASPTPRSTAPISFPASRRPQTRTTSSSTRPNGPAGASGASTTSASRPIRFWFGATDYKHDEVDSAAGHRHRLDLPATSSTRRAWRRSICPSRPRWACCAARSACSGRIAICRRPGADGILLDPDQHAKPRRLRLRGAAGDQEAALAGRRPHRERRRQGHGLDLPADFLPPPDDPTQTPAQRKFMPKSASAGFLYDLPLGVVARLTGQHVERAPDATELFYKGPHDSTATFEIGNPNLTIERANTFELGFKRAKGDFRFDASVYHTDFKNFIYKRFTGAKCDDDFASCGTGTRARPDRLLAAAMPRSTAPSCWPSTTSRRIWRGVWGIDGQYDFVHATLRRRHATSRRCRRIALGGGHLLSRHATGSRASNLLHAFAPGRVRHLRHARRRATTCSTPS